MDIKRAVEFLTCQAGTEVQLERREAPPAIIAVYLRRRGGRALWENQWESGGADGGEYVVISAARLAEGDLLRRGGRCWYVKEAHPYLWRGEAAYYQGAAVCGKEEEHGGD